MLVLNTDSVPVDDRADALRAAMTSAVIPSTVDVRGRGDEVWARIQAWQLGPSVSMAHVASSGQRVARSRRHLRGGDPEQISLAIQLSGEATLTHRDLPSLQRGDLQLVDLTSPHDYVSWPDSSAHALYVDAAHLGLPVDVVRVAAPRLRNSPLYELTRQHLGYLRQVADAIESRRSAAMLGAATVELVRALIASAAESPQQSHAAAESLLARIIAYMRMHLGEADLDPARIAAEHNISVRYLHLLFAQQQDLSVRRWLMRERLESARRVIATDAAQNSSIAVIARKRGFSDPGHFARRFRAAYGMSPRDWQQLNAAAEER